MKDPDLVTGDFDSITNDTKYRIEKTTAKFIQTTDQDETDFTKALVELQKHYIDQKNVKHLLFQFLRESK